MGRHHEDEDGEEKVVVVRGGSPVVPFLWGLAVGAAAALLFAPTSGEELRSNIRTRARHLKDLAVDKAGDIEEQVGETYERARAKVEDEIDTARHYVGETRQKVKEVASASRAAASTAREELERRLADAREARRSAREAPADEDPVA